MGMYKIIMVQMDNLDQMSYLFFVSVFKSFYLFVLCRERQFYLTDLIAKFH